MPGTLQDTLCVIQKLANLLFSPTQGFPFSRGSVTTNGIMLQESPGQLIPGILKLWREDTLCPQKWYIWLSYPEEEFKEVLFPRDCCLCW